MGQPHRVEASNLVGEIFHSRQNKRNRNLSNRLQGSDRPDKKAENVCQEAVWGPIVKGEGGEAWEQMEFSFLSVSWCK